MKRQLATALSVIGLVAVGIAAAVVNSRMLHDATPSSTTFEMRNAGAMAPFAPMAMPGTSATAAPSETATGMMRGGPMGMPFGEPLDGPRHQRGSGMPDARPPLTFAQMTLLRIAAMLHLDPATVRDVARGNDTDPATVAAVQEAAQAIGISLEQLAAVDQLPPMHDRGHGSPGRHRMFDSSTATTYDD